MIRDLINTGNNDQAGGGRETSLHWLPLYQVQDNPYQPRQHYDAEHILNLALSIKQLKGELPATRGLQQIPLARLGHLTNAGDFDAAPRLLYSDAAALRRLAGQQSAIAQLMFGHSRLRAFRVLTVGLAQFVGATDAKHPTNLRGYSRLSPGEVGIDIDLSTVADWQTTYADLMEADPDYNQFPVTLGFALDMAMWQHAITENSQRKNINAIEEAQTMARAQAEFGLTDEQAGQPFGYARSTAANKMRLLKLPANVQRDIAAGKLSERHGRELLRLADDQERLKKTYEYALKKGQTVAQITESVNWEAKALKEEQEKEREIEVVREILAAGWTPPGSTAPLPADRFVSGYPSYFYGADDKRMLKSGICGSHCQCCVLTYKGYSPEDLVRPDPERAPHIGLACAGDYEVRKAKQEALAALKRAGQVEASEAERQAAEERAQRKAKVAELNRQGREKWEGALAKLDKGALWQDMRFWRVATASIHYNWDTLGRRARSVAELQQGLLDQLFEKARTYNRDLGESVPDLAELDQMIAALTQPRPEGSRGDQDQESTNWQDDWDEDDQALYDDIDAEDDIGDDIGWAGLLAVLDGYDDISPRVLLRLIEECPDKAARGELWRRYRDMVGDESVSRETVDESEA